MEAPVTASSLDLFVALWTGAQVWDAVLNTSRDMVRAAICAEYYMGPAYTRRFIDLTCAYGIALEEFVCGYDRKAELDRVLTEADTAAIRGIANKPLAIIELLAVEICRAGRKFPDLSNSVHFGRLLGFADELSHQITTCQRLMKPPVPPMYYGHALRFLTLWTFTLPLALVSRVQMPCLVPAVGFVTWALYGLRELGVKSQQPFESGLVRLRELWTEQVWGAREAYYAATRAEQFEEEALQFEISKQEY